MAGAQGTTAPAAPGGSARSPPSSGRAATRGRLGSFLANGPALLPVLLLGLVTTVLVIASDLHNFGASFWSFTFNFVPPGSATSVPNSWGVGEYVAGTAITASLALLLATGLSLALAISLVVYLPSLPGRVLTVLTNLLAGIPSVVYGLWGFVVLAPFFGLELEPNLRDLLGWLPGFGGPASQIGPWGILLTVFLLTIMIVPLTTALMREALRAAPRDLVEAGLVLGATRWEVTRRIRMKVGRLGLWSAVLLGFGRAVGESVAVAMVIGGARELPASLYAPSITVASYVFSQLDSAFTYPDLLEFLVELTLVLMALAVVVNLAAQLLTRSEVATATTVGGAGGP